MYCRNDLKTIVGFIECHAVDGQHCIAALKKLTESADPLDQKLGAAFGEYCKFNFFFIEAGEKISK
jgi:hypothetical protein